LKKVSENLKFPIREKYSVFYEEIKRDKL